ncbi:MAG: chloramphenicol acetyltransferase [Porphyromonadaceae bacterium CG2_30_38_12]|nr:MAG: chloramphenicol acetyltransferase [Porphyromonadaceae bacterium CG2_30_38_12]
MKRPKKLIKKIGRKLLRYFYPQLNQLNRLVDMANEVSSMRAISSGDYNNTIDATASCFHPYHIVNSLIGSYTYIAINSTINNTTIGKFCSIGPNLICGWGIHPTNGISTAPMFYSTLKQNGITFSDVDKIQELKPITIGNDVFIGANVTILDGVTIGDGAVIGAGAVVSKDIPPYAIAVGCPIRIVRYRLEPEQIDKLLKINWWEFDEDRLKDVEQLFFEVNEFIEKYEK